MSFVKRVQGVVMVAMLGIGGVVCGQTGPGPAAARNAMGEVESVVPKSIYDGEAAAKIWNLRKGDKETTKALHARAEKMLRDMVENSNDLEYDTAYWRFLTFLRELPLDKMTDYRKAWYFRNMPNPRLTDEQRDYLVKRLEKTPIYKMTPKELDVYIGHVRAIEPDFLKRVVKFARQNLGQPYDIYLLGEFPHEVYDADPMFCLEKGDCVVFSEHMYGMALSHDWSSFYENLQKLRYKDGKPGMVTRNHFTEADWNINNQWLLEDITDKLDATTVTKFSARIDRARFFRNFGIGQDIPVERIDDEYIPAAAIEGIADKLQEGDFVNIVRGVGEGGVWVGHVGLIGKGEDGKTHFIHSAEPVSVEVPLADYVNRNIELNVGRAKRGSAEFKGMKFLRPRADMVEKYSGELETDKAESDESGS